MIEDKEPLYIQLYEHYKELIKSETLMAGSKLPSIRRCASERMVSRTTVEAAYVQLGAEGYIRSVPGSGFYVNHLDYEEIADSLELNIVEEEREDEYLYDFASATVDGESFNFELWRRYVKSALRNKNRLISYGDTQGEYDLRVALAHYIRERRGVVCTPEQIVIGAGVQSLLNILCSLLDNRSPVVFAGNDFARGRRVFEDRGIVTSVCTNLGNDTKGLKVYKPQIIYTSPSHVMPSGDAMPMQIRLACIAYARQNNCFIIEDDYDSEFRYYSRPVPSLQGLEGGHKVIYMGTFSKLLLPSLRISFMVLPQELMTIYRVKGKYYNQTASTAEQIALCQFIRDGHLEKQIKKARRLYMMKTNLLCEKIEDIFGDMAKPYSGAGGFIIRLEIETTLKASEIAKRARQKGVLVKILDEVEEEEKKACLLLSCSGIPEEHFEQGIVLLKECCL